MSNTGQRGHLSMAIQPAKIDAGTFTPASYAWRKHYMTEVDFGVDQIQNSLPLETGGSLFPAGAYKTGAYVGGAVSMVARMQSALGYYVYAAAGSYVATASAGAQAYVTRFSPDSTDETKIPWVAIRKYTPGSTGTNGLTEYGIDCKVASLTLTLPAAGPLACQVSFIGRRPLSVDNESVTGNALDDPTGNGLSCVSSITASGLGIVVPADAKFTGAQIMINNPMSSPGDEMIIGAYHPDDFTVLTRSCQIRLVYKWTDTALYKTLVSGGVAGSWSPAVVYSPVTINVASVANIGAPFTHPFKLNFSAQNVSFMMSPPRLIPGRLIMTELVGTVHVPVSGAAWTVEMWNTTNYATSIP